MKHIILISILFFFSCTSDDIAENLSPSYTVEDKWLWSPSENRADANTMYELLDNNVYTYYCSECLTDDDWNDLDSNDRIPEVKKYSFDGDSLEWYGAQRGVSFECNGGKLIMDGGLIQLWRLNSNCN